MTGDKRSSSQSLTLSLSMFFFFFFFNQNVCIFEGREVHRDAKLSGDFGSQEQRRRLDTASSAPGWVDGGRHGHIMCGRSGLQPAHLPYPPGSG